MNRRPHPALTETLEPRQLFSGIGFAQHRLSLVGSIAFPNILTVGLTPDGSSILAEVIVQTPKRSIDYSRTFPLSDGIRVVALRGGGSDDLITVDQTYGSFPIPCGIVGGDGSDTIMAGDEPDLIYGGKGSDYISGAGGNDTILGQAGDDTLDGGAGNDYLSGGADHDLLLGGEGNDTLADARGPDTVLGGAGDNTFLIHSLKADHDNDYDKLKDKLRIVTPAQATTSDNTSFLTSLFPILGLF